MKGITFTNSKMLSLLIVLFFLQTVLAAYPPFGLTVKDVSVKSLSVGWENFDDTVRQFVASISPLNDNENIEAHQQLTEKLVEWDGLISGKEYSIKVASVGNNGSMSSVSSINVTTVPAPPNDIRISKFVNPIVTEYEMSANSSMMYAVYGAVVMWSGPDAGYYDGYQVTVSPPDGMVRLPIELNNGKPVSKVRKKRRIVWDLVPGVYYEFHVKTTSNDQMSETVTTGERMPPEIPCPIQIDSISTTSVTLSWNHRPHRGIVDGYVVEIDPPEGSQIDPENPTEKGRRFINLTPGTIYNVEVYSSSFGILSFQSRTKMIKTPPYSPVGPIYSSNISQTYLTIHWEWPIGNVDYYEVVYFPTHQDHGRLRHRVFGLSVQLTSLEVGTEYSLILYAVSNGIYSKPLHALVSTKSLNTTDVPHNSAIKSVTTSSAVTVNDENGKKNTTSFNVIFSEQKATSKFFKGTESNEKETTQEVLLSLTSGSTATTKADSTNEESTTILNFESSSRGTAINDSIVETTSQTFSSGFTLGSLTTDELDVLIPQVTETNYFPNVEIQIEAVPHDETPDFDVETDTKPVSAIESITTEKVVSISYAITEQSNLLVFEQTTNADNKTTKIETTKTPSSYLQNRDSEQDPIATTNDLSKTTSPLDLTFSSKFISSKALTILETTPSTKPQIASTVEQEEAPTAKTERNVSTKSFTTASQNFISVSSTKETNVEVTTPNDLIEESSAAATTQLATITGNNYPETNKSDYATAGKEVTVINKLDNETNSRTSSAVPKMITRASPSQAETDSYAKATLIVTEQNNVHIALTSAQVFDFAPHKTATIHHSAPTTSFEWEKSTTASEEANTNFFVESEEKVSTVNDSPTKEMQTTKTTLERTISLRKLDETTQFTETPLPSNFKNPATEDPKSVATSHGTMKHNWSKMKMTTQSIKPTTGYFENSSATTNSKLSTIAKFKERTPKPFIADHLSSYSNTTHSFVTTNALTTQLPTTAEMISQAMETESGSATSPGVSSSTLSTAVRDTNQTVFEPLIITKASVTLKTNQHFTTNSDKNADVFSSLDPTKVPLVSITTKPSLTTTKIHQTKHALVEEIPESSALGSGEEGILKSKPTGHIRDGFKALCKPNNFTILVDKSVIGEYEDIYGPLYLSDHKDEKCRGIEYPTYYRYTIAPNILDCGTRMEVNETHVNFTNTLSNSFNETRLLQALANLNSGIIVGGKPIHQLTQFLHVRMWCTFPLDLNVSTLFPFLPQLTLQFLSFNISGVGEFSAMMQLYKTSEYKDPHPVSPKINITDTLYVGITLMDVENNSTFLRVERCWGTPVRSPNHPGAYPIIENGCPHKNSLDGTVQITENGESTRVKWEGSVFKFTSYDEVWLHCEIRVCLETTCNRSCDNIRERRSTNEETNNAKSRLISAGPVFMINAKSDFLEQPFLSTETTTTTRPFSLFLDQTTILVIAIAISVTIMVSCIAVSCVIIRHRRQRPHHKPFPTMPSYPMTSPIPDGTRSNRFLNPTFKSDDDFLLTTTSWNIAPTDLPSATKNVSHDWTLIGTNQIPVKKANTSRALSGIPPHFYESQPTLCKDQLASPTDSNLSISFYSEKSPSAIVTEDGYH